MILQGEELIFASWAWEDLFVLEDIRRTVKIDILDHQVIELLLNAEKDCRKIRTGEVEFLPEISKAAGY